MGARERVTRRGTSNSNSRGSSKDRLARKIWLLATFSPALGPEEAWCEFNCGAIVNIETITVDRYPILGADGGRYVRGNIRPACAKCNSDHGSREGARRAKERNEQQGTHRDARRRSGSAGQRRRAGVSQPAAQGARVSRDAQRDQPVRAA